MKRTLWLTLSRNDGLPDNKILEMFAALRGHGFIALESQAHADGLFSAVCEWSTDAVIWVRPQDAHRSVPSARRKDALAKLAKLLGQSNPKLDGNTLLAQAA